MFLSPNDVLRRGLQLVGFRAGNKTKESISLHFRSFYGSSQLDLAQMWYDICYASSPLPKNDRGEKGFKKFMAAHYFLWHYPKNAKTASSRFGASEKLMQGKILWTWISRIQALKTKKIKWMHSFRSVNSSTFIITVNCVDFKIHEPTDRHLPKAEKYFSQKHGSAGLKYEIAISVFESKVVWVNGPFPCGQHDGVVFGEGGLREKMLNDAAPGKRGIADGIYQKHKDLLSIPNTMDSKELHNFKSRARLRQEVFHGRMKNYECLSNCFRHSIEKHKMATEAVITTLCYQMDNGARLYDT